jgi:hypothetical protein
MTIKLVGGSSGGGAVLYLGYDGGYVHPQRIKHVPPQMGSCKTEYVV